MQEITARQTEVEQGFTASANAPGQVDSRASKTSLDQRLTSLAHDKRPSWEGLWRALMEERVIGDDGRPRPRWDWRKALYIAWRCAPVSVRQPQTLHELATDYLGLHDTATIRHWRAKDPEIEQRIAELPRELLMSHLASVYAALAVVAANPDPRCFQDRRLFLEITGEYSPKAEIKAEVETVALDKDEWRRLHEDRRRQALAIEEAFEGEE